MEANIILIGPMGSGKSTIGRQLSKRLRRRFVDSDHEIERRTGATIPLIFEIEGEEGFRKREEETIADLAKAHNIVLATGGGAVLRESNRKALQHSGIVIYLSATVDQLYQRIRFDRNRPLMQTDNPKETLKNIMQTREPLYCEMAHLVIQTGRRSVPWVVNRIEKRLRQMNNHADS